ncbi:MAG: outer membrane protein [Novosphingobium sp.]
MRKYFSIAAIAAATLASPAFAQDGEDDWNGAYIGVHVGYNGLKSDSAVALGGAWSTESTALQNEVTTRWSTSQSIDDLNYGAQIGYNFNAGGAVLGVEADISLLNGDDVRSSAQASTAFPALTYTYGNVVDPKHAISVRAKVGLPMGKTLFYAHGGWQTVRADVGASILSNGGYSKAAAVTENFDGYIVGAGIEHKLGSNISARLEYAYSDLGDVSYATAYRAGSTFTSPAYNETFTQDMRMHSVRLGLNFHF